MDKEAIVVPVRIDAEMFRNFAMFDTFTRQRRWVSPVVFSGILLVSAMLCFIQAPKQGAVLLGAVLCVVALGLPIVYFGMYLHSLNKQAKAMQLDKPKAVYTLRFTPAPDGIEITAGEQRVSLAWANVYGVWRVKDAAYIYAAPNKAYILPAAQVQGGMDNLWAMFEEKLAGEKVHGR